MSTRLAGVLAALTFLLLGGGQIYLSLRLPGGVGLSAAEPGPGLFPLLVGTFMCAAAVLRLVQAWVEQGIDRFDPRKDSRGIALLIGTIAAYIVLLPRVGFAICAFLMLLAALYLYGMPGTWRRVAVAAAVTLISFAVFTMLLGVNFPAPAWFN
jgi:putative tricarboxylic transport membrane protein